MIFTMKSHLVTALLKETCFFAFSTYVNDSRQIFFSSSCVACCFFFVLQSCASLSKRCFLGFKTVRQYFVA